MKNEDGPTIGDSADKIGAGPPLGCRLYPDDRLGGLRRWRMDSDEKWKMQIPDEIRKCVAFVGMRPKSGGDDWWGTCFFVSVPCEGRERRHMPFAVTARHCLKRAKDKFFSSDFHIRLNLATGTAIELATNIDDWVVHPTDDSIDVAILPIDWKPEYDHYAFPIESFISDDVIRDENVGPGDGLFLAGLFTRVPGEIANIPIIRVGTLAAMPEQLLLHDDPNEWPPMRGHLAEIRSYGGLSGSPVFINLGELRFKKHPAGPLPNITPFHFRLLGMIHGHYNEDRVNQGIAMVVPAKDILDLLSHPRLRECRKEFLKLPSNVSSTTDSVILDVRTNRG